MGKFFFFLSSVNKETNACDSVEEWESKLKISVSSYELLLLLNISNLIVNFNIESEFQSHFSLSRENSNSVDTYG